VRHSLGSSRDIDIDGEQFAAIIGGRWEAKPPDTWRYRGLCWHADAYVPGRIILARGEGFRYGVDLSTLKTGRSDAGIIFSGDARPSIAAPILRVDSIHQAVRRLACFLRSETHTPIIAVTGSVGKTSSCYLLHHLLGYKGCVTTNGQLNYPDGIVCEIGNLGEVDYAVIEASLQGLGEATAILKPHVAVLTQISSAHLDRFDSLLALAKKKASLFNDLAPGGTAIINRDIVYFDDVLKIASATATTVLTFGAHAEADFQLVNYDAPQQRIRARILGEDVEYELGLRGRHMAINSLGVLAAAHAVGAEWKSLLAYCAGARLVAGRGALEHLKIAGVRISMIDDAYNASPAAMEAAFATLAATAPSGKGRRIAVLADMLELGKDSAEYHRRLAGPLLESGVDEVFLAGKMMRCLWEELPPAVRAPMPAKTDDLLLPLVSNLMNGDVILLKGSHGTGMHAIADELRCLALVPGLRGVGPQAFILLRNIARRIGPHTPAPVKRWVLWQINKLIKQKRRDAP
jgi:UDP-N-acetylmuramoyl-tripeptide--D-alanyl-D-alanine ligase